MNEETAPGGIIHTYLGYDPVRFPSPSAPPPDLASAAMEHLLTYGDRRPLTEEELANAVRLDPSQIKGLGPSLDSIAAMLQERKRKILETYETSHAQKQAAQRFRNAASEVRPPKNLADRFHKAVRDEQLYDLERLFYSANDDNSPFAIGIVNATARLGDKYQVEELASKYTFTGQTKMDVEKALEVKEELETIDKLLEQIKEAMKTAQIGIIDMDELSEMIDMESMQGLRDLQQQINEYLRDQAERQGLQGDRSGYHLTPKAIRLFQSRLLTTIFEQMQASKTGRHPDAVTGEGAVETQRTKPYEFGDSVSQMDIPGSMVNAMLRQGAQLPVRLTPRDIEVHRTQVTPKAATCVLLDMSGSMRYDELYVNVKRMGLALDALIRREYPGDFLQFIEMFTFAKARPISEVASLMPKPVTIHSPVVRLKADMADPDINELQVPPHFTNIQHALQLGRRFLSSQDTPNRQMVLITDGLPTAHFEGSTLFLLYPPDRRTEEATMREAMLCAKEGITLNIFLLQSWNQSHEDVRFAYRLAETTKGRVVFTAGKDLERFVIWDYLKRKRSIVS